MGSIHLSVQLAATASTADGNRYSQTIIHEHRILTGAHCPSIGSTTSMAIAPALSTCGAPSVEAPDGAGPDDGALESASPWDRSSAESLRMRLASAEDLQASRYRDVAGSYPRTSVFTHSPLPWVQYWTVSPMAYSGDAIASGPAVMGCTHWRDRLPNGDCAERTQFFIALRRAALCSPRG